MDRILLRFYSFESVPSSILAEKINNCSVLVLNSQQKIVRLLKIDSKCSKWSATNEDPHPPKHFLSVQLFSHDTSTTRFAPLAFSQTRDTILTMQLIFKGLHTKSTIDKHIQQVFIPISKERQICFMRSNKACVFSFKFKHNNIGQWKFIAYHTLLHDSYFAMSWRGLVHIDIIYTVEHNFPGPVAIIQNTVKSQI